MTDDFFAFLHTALRSVITSTVIGYYPYSTATVDNILFQVTDWNNNPFHKEAAKILYQIFEKKLQVAGGQVDNKIVIHLKDTYGAEYYVGLKDGFVRIGTTVRDYNNTNFNPANRNYIALNGDSISNDFIYFNINEEGE